MKNKKRYNVNKIKRNLSYHVLTAVTVYWLERLDINSTSCIQIVMNSAGRVICGLNMFDHISRVCVINFTGCQFHDECNINFVCWCTRLIRGLRLRLPACFSCQWQKRTSIVRAVTLSPLRLQQTLDDVSSPCLYQCRGTVEPASSRRQEHSVAAVLHIQTQDSSVHVQSLTLTNMILTLMRCLQTVCALAMSWRHVTAR